jgi:hypothetical protein
MMNEFGGLAEFVRAWLDDAVQQPELKEHERYAVIKS